MPVFYVGQTDYINQLNVLSSSSVIPTVVGNTGKYLTTDGTSTTWSSLPAAYSLPTASTTVLGGIKVDGTTININGGVISASALSTATTTTPGIVKVDGSSLAFNASGQLYYTGLTPGGIPIATTTTIGGIKIDGTTITINNGIISGFNGTFAALTSKPTTLVGYGISDSLTAVAIADAINTERTRASTAEALLAPKFNPIFTGIVTGVTKAMVGLDVAENTTDLNKPVSTATIAAIKVADDRAIAAEALKAPIASPTFTGTVAGITKAMVGLSSVNDTSDANKPVSTAQAAAIKVETDRALAAEALLAPQTTTYTKTETDTRIQAVVGAAPAALDTLVEIAAQLTADESIAGALATAVSLKAPRASPTFTGTVAGISKTMVGLEFAENTTDLNKPVSTATIAAIKVADDRAIAAEALKAPKASPTFTGTVSGITKVMVGLDLVDNTTDATKPVSTAQAAAIKVANDRAIAAEALLAPKASPTFTGTVAGITKAMVGLDLVDNTADTAKPVSTSQAAAIKVVNDRALVAEALLAPQATTYTKTETDTRIQAIVGAAPAALDTLVEIATQLAADETAAGALTTAVSLKAPSASPTFTGTVSGIDKTMVGLSSVDDTTDLNKPVSTAQAAAIKVADDRAKAAELLLAPKASPTFTGTVSGITKVMVGLANVDNTTDENKPVSTLQAAAIKVANDRAIAAEALLAPKASPTFTGTVAGISKTMVGLEFAENTTDLNKPVSTATIAAIKVADDRAIAAEALKAPIASPTFTGTVAGITKAMVGLSSVNDTSDANKPVSTAQAAAIKVETDRALAAEALLAPQTTTYTKTETDTRIQAVVGAAPAALDTLVEIAAQLALDETAAASLTTVVSLKAPIASPIFTGIVKGIDKTMVGLDLVDNTKDTDKPVSTLQAAAIKVANDRAIAAEDLLAPKASPTFTGTVTISGALAGYENVNNTKDTDKPVSTAQANAIKAVDDRAKGAESLLAPIASPIFTGIVKGIDKTMVGLDLVDNTKDTDKPVSTPQAEAIKVANDRAIAAEDLLAPKASPTFTGIVNAQNLVLSSYGTVKGLKEVSIIYNIAPTLTTNFDFINAGILYYTALANSNFTLNIRGNSTTTLNSIVNLNESITITFMMTNGTSAYYPNVISIDGVRCTPKWLAGAIPINGNASAIDIYSISFIKIASGTWTVLASRSKFV